jgi:hypothetical protein
MCQECRAAMRCGDAARFLAAVPDRMRELGAHDPADACESAQSHYLTLAERAPGSLMPNSYRDVAALLEREADKIQAEEAEGRFR